MEYTCTYCRKPFNINPAESAGAVIDYTFGKKTHNFKCDNCGKDNALTKAQYEALKEAAENPTPVAGAGSKPVAQPVAQPGVKPVAPQPVAKPSTQPSPLMGFAKRTAVVKAHSLHVRKDHSTKAETMAGLTVGEKVTVLSTWSDGKNTWAEIGPDRWAAMVYNGDTLMEFED